METKTPGLGDESRQRRASERFENEGGSTGRAKPPTATSAEPQGERMLSDQELHERPVIAADGKSIGAITALILDAHRWSIRSVVVKVSRDLAGELGSRRGMFRARTLEIPVDLIQSVGDSAVVLSVPTSGLHKVLAGAGESVTTH